MKRILHLLVGAATFIAVVFFGISCKTTNRIYIDDNIEQIHYVVVWETDRERVDAVFDTKSEAETYVSTFDSFHNYAILEKRGILALTLE